MRDLFRVIFAALASIATLTGAQSEVFAPIPATASFSFSETESKTTIRAHIADTGTYAVSAQFHHQPKKLRAGDFNFLLGIAHQGADGEWEEPGVPATFRIEVVEPEHPPRIFDVSHPKTSAWAYGRVARLLTLKLTQGNYEFRISGTSQRDALRQIPVKIVISPAHHGK